MKCPGNVLLFLNVKTGEQRYLRSVRGEGIGCVSAHPSGKFFAVGEKGRFFLWCNWECGFGLNT